MVEFASWLSSMPSESGKTLDNCCPGDLLVYMEDHWLPRHPGTMLPNGERVASPSGVNGVLSNLSTAFGLLSRHGEYNDATGKGNPVLSSEVGLYRQGYKNQVWREGYQEGSAVPMTESKYRALISFMDGLCDSKSSVVEQLCIERDVCLYMYAWESSLRGKDAGKITLQDFFDSRGVLLDLYSLVDVVEGFSLCIIPNGTKTVKGRRAEAQCFDMTEDTQFCFLSRLLSYVHHCKGAGFPITTYVFRPLDGTRKGFKEQAYMSSGLWHSIVKYLTLAGLFEGETAHSFRRGGLQAAFYTGSAAFTAVQERAQLKSPGIVKRYLNTARHIPRLRKQVLQGKVVKPCRKLDV
jgi:hypothetical protein